MKVSIRSALARGLLCAVALGSTVGGLAIGTGSLSSPAAASTTVGLDHFLCYTVTTVTNSTLGFVTPKTVGLLDQFARFPAVPEAVGYHCNPVQKTAKGVVYKITNPNAHLLCWTVEAQPQSAYEVKVTNQFGTAKLVTAQPRLLCLPTWKSLTGPPKEPTVAPPGLSHFTCYSVSYFGTSHFNPPPTVSLTDQFGSFRTHVGFPELLCLPTQKTVNGVVTKMIDPAAHLLCFMVSSDVKSRNAYDKNQFGTGEIAVRNVSLLCVPSIKTVIRKIVTTTPTTTTTSTRSSATTSPSTTTVKSTTTSSSTGSTTTTSPSTGSTTSSTSLTGSTTTTSPTGGATTTTSSTGRTVQTFPPLGSAG